MLLVYSSMSISRHFKAHSSPARTPVYTINKMEAFYSDLSPSKVESGRIVIESRDDNLNLSVQRAFFEVFNSGILHLDVDSQRDKIKGFIIAPKDDTIYQSSLEIADIICNPLSRVRQGMIEAAPKCMRDYGDENKIFKAIKDRIYVGNPSHDFRNWGFKKVPIVKRKRNWIDDPA